jgi:hypothetical protein
VPSELALAQRISRAETAVMLTLTPPPAFAIAAEVAGSAEAAEVARSAVEWRRS